MGTVPDWLAGVGAIAALTFAAWAAHSAHETNKSQANQLRELQKEALERADQELRSQARHVSAWLSENLTVAYSNTSTEPVYTVEIGYGHEDNPVASITRGVISPNADNMVHPALSDEIRKYARDAAVRRLGLDPDYNWAVDNAHASTASAEYARLTGVVAAEGIYIRFRDAAGNLWSRNSEGILRLLSRFGSDE